MQKNIRKACASDDRCLPMHELMPELTGVLGLTYIRRTFERCLRRGDLAGEAVGR